MKETKNDTQIKLYLNSEDKEQLEALAAGKNLSLSAYIRETLKKELPKKEKKVIDRDEIAPGGLKEKSIKIYLTEAEYNAIKAEAGEMSVSTYFRNFILDKASGKYIFEIKTDDITELNETMAEINMHIDGFIGALRFRNDIYQADIDRLVDLLAKVNEAVTTLSKDVYNNREITRKNAKKDLKARIKKVVK